MQTLAEAVALATERLDACWAQLPLGPRSQAAPGRETSARSAQDEGASQASSSAPYVSGVLMDVFPLLAKGAKVLEVAEATGLSPCTVQGRKKRILRLFHTNSIYKAAEQAQAMGILQ